MRLAPLPFDEITKKVIRRNVRRVIKKFLKFKSNCSRSLYWSRSLLFCHKRVIKVQICTHSAYLFTNPTNSRPIIAQAAVLSKKCCSWIYVIAIRCLSHVRVIIDWYILRWSLWRANSINQAFIMYSFKL